MFTTLGGTPEWQTSVNACVVMVNELTNSLGNSVVVMLSRNQSCDMITIVADNAEWAIKRMWRVLCTGTRWTRYIENLLEKVTVNRNTGSNNVSRVNRVIDMAELYPYRVCDIALPLEPTGFVYLLVSTTNFQRTYCGQSESIARRINEHNSGYGSTGTAPGKLQLLPIKLSLVFSSTLIPYEQVIYQPYCIAAYLCNMRHMSTAQRMSLESKWSRGIRALSRSGRQDLESRIDVGERIMVEYNDTVCEQDKIRLVVTIKRRNT